MPRRASGDSGHKKKKRRHLLWCRLFSCLLAEDASEVGLASGRDEKLWPDLTGCVDTFGEDEGFLGSQRPAWG